MRTSQKIRTPKRKCGLPASEIGAGRNGTRPYAKGSWVNRGRKREAEVSGLRKAEQGHSEAGVRATEEGKRPEQSSERTVQ